MSTSNSKLILLESKIFINQKQGQTAIKSYIEKYAHNPYGFKSCLKSEILERKNSIRVSTSKLLKPDKN